MAATPKSENGVLSWTHRGRRSLRVQIRSVFDHQAFFVGYNLTNVFYGIMKVGKEIWVLPPEMFSQLYSLQCQKMSLCKYHLNSIKQPPFIVFDRKDSNTIRDYHDSK